MAKPIRMKSQAEWMEDRDALIRVFGHIWPDMEWDDSAAETARRVMSYWSEFTNSGNELNFNFTTFTSTVDQMILFKDLEFVSVCAHHLLPFWGVGHIAYIPHRLMVGASKVPRLLDFWSKRPSTQEQITANVAKDLKSRLDAKGVAVILQARHTCMACRGVHKPDSSMITSEMRGIYLTAPAARQEFMDALLLKLP